MHKEYTRARKATSLVDLCVRIAIDNVRYLGDVGETDLHLLQRILPHCSLDQLMHVEKSSVGRDLSPITDELWKRFYEQRFGRKDVNLVIERMRQNNVAFRWIQLYEAKLKDLSERENKLADQLKQSYKKEVERKHSRQVKPCTKVPPSSNKRSFYGASGPGYNVSNLKSNLMKKAKVEFLKSREVANIAAMKKQAVQRNPSTSRMVKPCGVSGKSCGSTSRYMKPPGRRS